MLVFAVACSAESTVVSENFDFDGTCVNCHAGLSAGQVHATFKLRCVDCHGGNDQVDDVPDNAFENEADYRNPALIKASHVQPKPGLARFFWANGVDDDDDGEVDEGPECSDPSLTIAECIAAGESLSDFGEIAELGLHGEGVGLFIDSEYNRDLNYTRWLNPGDLRVATVGCGSQSRAALDGSGGGACHQGVVESMRRSIMTGNSAVINGAYYGNEGWRPTFQQARDDRGAAEDPRAGAFAYTMNYAGADTCIDTSAVGDEDSRGQPVFDSQCLEALAAAQDPNAVADAPGNDGLPALEITQGPVVGSAPGTEPGQTLRHQGAENQRFFWGGTALVDPAAALPELQPVPNEDLTVRPGVTVRDPVDLILRNFRAYFPLNYVGSQDNIDFTFGTSILPEIDELQMRNPFGRGRSSGCTSCHMANNYDGSRDPQRVVTAQDGGLVEELIEDPTTKHREFDPATEDIVDIDGELQVVGVAVKADERALTGREMQRFYTAQHEITTQITTDQCSLCHAFVTRINQAYTGTAEDENRDAYARRAPIEFTTQAGTQVRILDSLVRNQCPAGTPVSECANGNVRRELVVPEGDQIARLAIARNAELAEQGLVPGGGGCGEAVFTEDCNNNGELDTQLVLQRVDESGTVIATATINEDLNGNGQLDIIDHVPRQFSLDGRQMRYVYGGANGSTRMMDVHYERGMTCIDCHFLQDTHGDGNLYSTNWDQIEIECEDCHGTLGGAATLVTSGANGGNDLTQAFDSDGRPFFERSGDGVIQRSRVVPGVFWNVPQVPNILSPGHPDFNPRAVAAMGQESHMPPPNAPGERTQGSTFAGERGASELETATLECYACHSSWVHNCLACHYNANYGDVNKVAVDANGNFSLVPGENETWYNNFNQPGTAQFQLLELMRSPFVLGVNATADANRLAPFRSSMELYVSASGAGGHTLLDDITFTTFQAVDGNSGRVNAATSASAMNQTMPHTVRPSSRVSGRSETQDCDTCHRLVDQQGRVRNDHIVGQTVGVGVGRYAFTGNWIYMAGTGGVELFDYKQDGSIKGTTAGASTRFPGIIVNPVDRVAANIEPVLDGSGGVGAAFVGTDVALIRNFNPPPAGPGQTSPPLLKDLAVTALSDGADGKLMISDVTFRGHPDLAARPSVGDAGNVVVVDLPGPALGLDHLSPDISEPYVYVAVGEAGLAVVELDGNPADLSFTAELADTTALPGDAVALEVQLVGDIAYVAAEGGLLAVFDVSNPTAPSLVTSVNLPCTGQTLADGGFILYVGGPDGVCVLDISDPAAPADLTGATNPIDDTNVNGMYLSGNKLYLASVAEADVIELDVTVPAAPVDLGGVIDRIRPLDVGPDVGAVAPVDVVLSRLAGPQEWLLIADTNGDLVGVKLDRRLSVRERCLPNVAANGCSLDMDWRDFTMTGRDPSFDPVAGAFDGDDPSGDPIFRQPGSIVSAARRLARPAELEQINTQTGRRLRDSFMPGSGTISQPVMKRMYDVLLCEAAGTPDVSGNGLGELGIADDNFFGSGTCRTNAEVGQDGTVAELRSRNVVDRVAEVLGRLFQP